MKSVSIILPVYNVEKYVGRCLESIINQTFKDFELILVDDCGSDGSIALCRQLLTQSSLDFRIIRNNTNIGVSESRKVGLQNSHSKFVLFVDSDDWIDHAMLEKLYNTALAKEADMVSAAAIRYWEHEGTYTDVPNLRKGIYSSEDYLKAFFRGVNNPEMWARLIKRDILNEINFPKKAIHEDMLMMPYIIEKAKTIAHIEDPLYFYLKRKSNSSITETKPKNLQGFLHYLQKIKSDFTSNKTSATMNTPSQLFYYKHLLRVTYSTTHFSDTYSDAKKELKLIRSYLINKNIYSLRQTVNYKQLVQLGLLKMDGYLFFSSYKLLYFIKQKSNYYS